mgnify:CR=1 FL=1
MESEPFVSIVIPTTGKIKFIRGLVKSVIELDYPKDKLEWIIIDDLYLGGKNLIEYAYDWIKNKKGFEELQND